MIMNNSQRNGIQYNEAEFDLLKSVVTEVIESKYVQQLTDSRITLKAALDREANILTRLSAIESFIQSTLSHCSACKTRWEEEIGDVRPKTNGQVHHCQSQPQQSNVRHEQHQQILQQQQCQILTQPQLRVHLQQKQQHVQNTLDHPIHPPSPKQIMSPDYIHQQQSPHQQQTALVPYHPNNSKKGPENECDYIVIDDSD